MTESLEPRARLQAAVTERTQDTLGHVLTRASRLFNEQALQAVHAAGFPEVRESWIALLRHLDPPGVRSSVLAERLGVTRQAAGQLVSELERAGYLERVADLSDGRAKLVRMTERGLHAWLAGLQALRTLQDDLRHEVGADALSALQSHGSQLLLALQRISTRTPSETHP